MIYICIPAHNEEQTVGVVLWKVRQVMAELGRDYQLLVADDGSTDRTPAVLQPYTRVLPLTVYRTDTRRGYAAALELLLREALRRSEYPRRDVIIVLQADFSEDPQHVETLVKRIESGADIIASNTVYGGVRPTRKYRWGRAAMNRLLRRFAWPERVRDPLAGLNAYRVATVKRALEERNGGRLLQHEGWAANAELLKEAAPHARRVDVVELEHRRERLQREERFHFMPVFREVFALVRGRVTDPLPPEQLQADSVHGGRALRTPVAESLRDSVAHNGASREGGDRRRNGPARRHGENDRKTGGRTRKAPSAGQSA
ncbi:MAG: glycosyltransferase family 2 protein, partial [Longimicrobiales bacterium]